MEEADQAVRELLATRVLRPNVIEAALSTAIRLLTGDAHPVNRRSRRAALVRDLRAAEKTLANLVSTGERGGAVPAVIEALQRKEDERRAIEQQLAALDGGEDAPAEDQLRRELRALLADWHGLLRTHDDGVSIGMAADARAVLQTALDDRIVFEPVDDASGKKYRLRVPIAFDRVLEQVILGLQVRVTSPTGVVPEWSRAIPGEIPAVGGSEHAA